MVTRGGVIREQDGFEVFYGTAPSNKPKPVKPKPDSSRDGFDIFYGIKGDRAPRSPGPVDRRATFDSPCTAAPTGAAAVAAAVATSLGESSSGKKERKEQQRQLEAQLQPRLTGDSTKVQRAPSGSPLGGFREVAVCTEAEENTGSEDQPKMEQPDLLPTPAPSPAPTPAQSGRDLLSTSGQSLSASQNTVEVYSLCGRSPGKQLPGTVSFFSMATPNASFVPPSEPQPQQPQQPQQQPPEATRVASAQPKGYPQQAGAAGRPPPVLSRRVVQTVTTTTLPGPSKQMPPVAVVQRR